MPLSSDPAIQTPLMNYIARRQTVNPMIHSNGIDGDLGIEGVHE